MKIKGYDHIGLNVKDYEKSVNFYKDLFEYLGLEHLLAGKKNNGFGTKDHSFSIWIKPLSKKSQSKTYDNEAPGLQHLAFRATSKAEVDNLYKEYLKPNKIKVLYGGPSEMPYAKGYYAVYFEDPDGIKLELVWIPDHK